MSVLIPLFLVLQFLGIGLSALFMWKSVQILKKTRKNIAEAKAVREETTEMLAEITKLNKDTEFMLRHLSNSILSSRDVSLVDTIDDL